MNSIVLNAVGPRVNTRNDPVQFGERWALGTYVRTAISVILLVVVVVSKVRYLLLAQPRDPWESGQILEAWRDQSGSSEHCEIR